MSIVRTLLVVASSLMLLVGASLVAFLQAPAPELACPGGQPGHRCQGTEDMAAMKAKSSDSALVPLGPNTVFEFEVEMGSHGYDNDGKAGAFANAEWIQITPVTCRVQSAAVRRSKAPSWLSALLQITCHAGPSNYRVFTSESSSPRLIKAGTNRSDEALLRRLSGAVRMPYSDGCYALTNSGLHRMRRCILEADLMVEGSLAAAVSRVIDRSSPLYAAKPALYRRYIESYEANRYHEKKGVRAGATTYCYGGTGGDCSPDPWRVCYSTRHGLILDEAETLCGPVNVYVDHRVRLVRSSRRR